MSIDFDTIERFIGKVHLSPPIPAARATLIHNGISREEYRRRFGMDEASASVFMARESVANVAKVMRLPKPGPRVIGRKVSLRNLILNLLKTSPAGLTSVQLSDLLGADRRSITTRLNELKEMNEVRGERIPGHAGYALNWFAKNAEQKQPTKHNFSGTWPSVKDIQNVVADEFNLTAQDLIDQTRVQCIVRARFVAIYLCSEIKPDMSSFDLGSRFGGRDHSTIVCALKRACKMIADEPDLAARVDRMRAFLTAKRSAAA
jgi:hypothetical protein